MGSARPTPAAIRRALEAVAQAGHQPGGVELRRDGSVVVLIVAKGSAQPIRSPEASEGDNPCDAIFGIGRAS